MSNFQLVFYIFPFFKIASEEKPLLLSMLSISICLSFHLSIYHLLKYLSLFAICLRTYLNNINRDRDISLYYYFKTFKVLSFIYKSLFFLKLIFCQKQGFDFLFFHMDYHNLLNSPSFPHLSAMSILLWIKFSCMSGSVHQFPINYFIG